MVDRCAHPRSMCRDDAACGPNGSCRSIPGDPRAPCMCVGEPPAPVRGFCNGDGGLGEGGCCADEECVPPEMGRAICHQQVYNLQNRYCGGAAPPETNQCKFDQCGVDADCAADRVCVPAGAFGYVLNTCVPAGCRVDADCNARPGGECRPFFTPCYARGFACTYADDPCRVDADCPPGRFGDAGICVPGPDGTQCIENLPAP